MTPQTRLRKVRQFITHMPSLSTTVTKVMAICNDPAASPNDLNKVISLDPVLTGQVLKLINSAYYSLPNRITSLTRAIIMLGINTVKNLVLATAVLSSFKGHSAMRGLPVDEFWEHSLAVGAAARILAGQLEVPVREQEEFFVAGLLHDLGKLPIMANFPAIYEKVIRLHAEQAMRSVAAEQQLLGLDHCQVNHLIFAKWQLGRSMFNAAAFHHQPQGAQAARDQVLYTVALANEAMRWLREPSARTSDPDQDGIVPFLETACHIALPRVLALRAEIEAQIEKARVFLNLAGKG